MSKELSEFYTEWGNDLKTKAAIEQSNDFDEFIIDAIDRLTEADEIDEFEMGYSELKGQHGVTMLLDGYTFDSVDRSCSIAVADYSDSPYIETLTQTDIDQLYEKMRRLVEHSISGYITNPSNRFAQTSSGYEFADLLLKKEANAQTKISKFRFIIITNKIISKRVKNIKKDSIDGRQVDLNVWDIQRFYNLYGSTQGKEEVDVDTSAGGGIPCVKTMDCEDYTAYLAVISGEVLANIYLDHGARLLEGNVRSFLSARGKVNKAIRNTIIDYPERFFAYNNGISVTATAVAIEESFGQQKITKIDNMQIINGGQTTASIANAKLQDKDKADLSRIAVPMKLTVIKDRTKVDEMVPAISRSANSQNKVDEADFFSNHPYHIRIEELSRKTFAPPKDGNQYPTLWFYERARGQYVQAQMKFTKSEKKAFQAKNPKDQLLKKVDVAKFVNSYSQLPHVVSKGAQANMRIFAEKISKDWKNAGKHHGEVFDERYYKNLISLAILFKGAEKLVSLQPWYKIEHAYRANIVTYSIAVLKKEIDKQCPGKSLPLHRLWQDQGFYPELVHQLERTTREIHDFIIREDRVTQNVTEWCKRKECWERAEAEMFTLLDEFRSTLVEEMPDITDGSNIDRQPEAPEKDEVDIVVELGATLWQQALAYGRAKGLLSAMEDGMLSAVANMEWNNYIPTTQNASLILDVYRKLKDEGFVEKTKE